jgi:sugar lactone lactonase YvrE
MIAVDDRRCWLGEGPIWHPQRAQMFWFDILNDTLMTRDGDTPREGGFDANASAAGWVDRDTFLVATANGLETLNVETGAHTPIAQVENDNLGTRSNDGRADPYGGFWFGTMAHPGVNQTGAIYRYYRGEVRTLFPQIAIPNATCFSPDGTRAYFADTPDLQVMTVRLDETHGWPVGDPEVFLDFSAQGALPDGAVVDAAGNIWIAFYNGAEIAAFDPNGTKLHSIAIPAKKSTCPAFGGADLTDLYCTSCYRDVDDAELADYPQSGRLVMQSGFGPGQPEHQVIL